MLVASLTHDLSELWVLGYVLVNIITRVREGSHPQGNELDLVVHLV